MIQRVQASTKCRWNIIFFLVFGGTPNSHTQILKISFSSALVPIYDVNLNFVCVTNKKVKLELEGSNYALVYNNFLLFDNLEMSENHSYILTKEDGTKLYISPKYGLTKAVDTNGNTITVSKNGFKHSNGMGIDFTRDKNGRITKATEKDKDGNEIDSMSYVYDENDNLIMNIDKAGRNVTYTYDNNHNLIDIIDPSGIAVARNEYDDEGRLVATIDALSILASSRTTDLPSNLDG